MNSCRNPMMALLLLPGGMNVEISVRKRKLPAMLSVLAACLWERVGRCYFFHRGWEYHFFSLSVKPLLRQNCHKVLSHMIIDLTSVQIWPLSHSMVLWRLLILRTFSRSCTKKPFLLLLLGCKGCVSRTRTLGSNRSTWPWWCPVSTVQLNTC